MLERELADKCVAYVQGRLRLGGPISGSTSSTSWSHITRDFKKEHERDYGSKEKGARRVAADRAQQTSIQAAASAEASFPTRFIVNCTNCYTLMQAPKVTHPTHMRALCDLDTSSASAEPLCRAVSAGMQAAGVLQMQVRRLSLDLPEPGSAD